MFSGSDTTIGLDLGTSGARAVEVVWRGGRPAVERWASVEYDKPILDWTQENGALTRLLTGLTAGQGMRGRWVAHAVSGEAVAPQYFNFPRLMPEDVAEAVRIEVETALPFQADRALISYLLFPEQRMPQGKARTHGLAIAADGAYVDARLNLIRRAGLEPFSVESDSIACANALLASRPEAKGTIAVLNIGYRYSNLALIGGHDTLLVRDVPWAGSHLTEALAERMNVSVEEAEVLKRRHWAGDPAAVERIGSTLRDALHDAARDFSARVHSTIQYWLAERLVPGIEGLCLTGGGSLVAGMPEFLSETFSLPVERWSPMAGAAPLDPHAAAEAHRMSVAYGLALRFFSQRNTQ